MINQTVGLFYSPNEWLRAFCFCLMLLVAIVGDRFVLRKNRNEILQLACFCFCPTAQSKNCFQSKTCSFFALGALRAFPLQSQEEDFLERQPTSGRRWVKICRHESDEQNKGQYPRLPVLPVQWCRKLWQCKYSSADDGSYKMSMQMHKFFTRVKTMWKLHCTEYSKQL